MIDHAKIRFTHENSDGGTDIESMWAIRRDEGYEIDSIPFRVMAIAVGDLVAARTDKAGLLWFDRVTKPSGHSTVQIIFGREEDVAPFRARLAQIGCASEGSDLPELIAVDVPVSVNYEDVRVLLDEGERDGLLEYQEACLGHVTVK